MLPYGPHMGTMGFNHGAQIKAVCVGIILDHCQFLPALLVMLCTAHYSDVIMSMMASQMTSLMIVYPTIHSAPIKLRIAPSDSKGHCWHVFNNLQQKDDRRVKFTILNIKAMLIALSSFTEHAGVYWHCRAVCNATNLCKELRIHIPINEINLTYDKMIHLLTS